MSPGKDKEILPFDLQVTSNFLRPRIPQSVFNIQEIKRSNKFHF